MAAKQTHAADQYITQLKGELQRNNIEDVDDILADYRDYFAQSKAKGYNDTESIRRLPTTQELVASYTEGTTKNKQSPKSRSRLSPAQRFTVFGASVVGDIILLPIVGITVLLLACFAIVGVSLVVIGPLLFIPDSMLGQMDVTRPPLMQLLPAALLLMAAGTVIVGICMIITERIYSTIRASIVMRRWLLTGNRNDQLRLIPRISKPLRRLFYKIILVTALVAILMTLILMTLAFITEGTVDFLSMWRS